jgi:PAS domain S-box-containing protein
VSVAAKARIRMRGIVGAYAVISGVWSYLITTILSYVITNEELRERVIVYKGAIVFLTTLMLFLVLSRMVKRISKDQEKLARREWFLNLQFERMPLVCIVFDAHGRVESWNPCAEKVFGYTALEAIGMHASVLVPAASLPDVKTIWQHLLAGADQQRVANENITKGGQIIVCEWTNTPLIDSNGQILGVLSMAQDITEKRNSEAELRNLEREVQHTLRLESLGALAGGVAHDINNILASIVSVAEVVEMVNPDNEKIHRHIAMLMRAAFRGRDLVKSLTSFARKEVATHAPVDLNTVAATEVDLLARTTRQMVDIKTDYALNLPTFEGDEASITNALMNLCINSLDAMPEGGTLTISTRRVNGWVEISVADTGTGMTPEVKQRALEPFFTTKRVGEGTGLGLSMMYGTVKAHGGSVIIDSTEGVGTTITMRFPHDAGIEKTETQSTPSAPSRVIENLSIVLVDDDELLQAAASELLRGIGHEIVVIPRGQEAIDFLKSGQREPDLIILDLNMPGMTGFEVLKHLREFSDVPVAVMSGYINSDIEHRLSDATNIKLLAKPFSLEDLKQIFIWATELKG